MPKLKVDGIEVEVPNGATVLQACEAVGKEVPRFCYHERLSIAGNCRMCLVEIKPGPPKPAASCAMPAADNMEVFTESPMVVKARKGVMEFLLINHPLDCPICDQGGECDLQDQAMGYGMDHSRFKEMKRAVTDKYMGPLIKTIMTRCIHCTRCVRFADEVAGVPVIGALGRGEHMEITTLENAVTSEMSGNLVDICPVGALTSKPYAFEARPWELRKTESIDVMDAMGCNIRIDARGSEVMRVLPRVNEAINEEWIGDKTRHACDGLKRQRLDRPYVRKGGKLVAVGWDEALAVVADRLQKGGDSIAAIAGDQVDAESMLALKDLFASLNSPNIDCRQDGAALDAMAPASYRFNSTIAGIDQADAILLIGADPRWEAPVLNARIRKRWLQARMPIAAIGEVGRMNYPVTQLGNDPAILNALGFGEHEFAQVLKGAQRPMIIVGQGALTRPDGAAILGAAWRIAQNYGLVRDGWNGFNVLHTAAARVGGLILGLVPGPDGRDVAGILAGAQAGAVETVYLLGADEIETKALGNAFVIYQGHHGDAGAHRADVILPGAAYTEKSGTWVNTEGRAQRGNRAAFPPGEAKEDWAILRALSGALGKPLPYDTLSAVRARLATMAPEFARIDTVIPASWTTFGLLNTPENAPFKPSIANFYMTDPISRASETMARCMAELLGDAATEKKTGTHG